MGPSDESALRISIDGLREGVQVVGFDWRYVYVNDAACRHGRRPRNDLVGRTVMECDPQIEQTELFAVFDRVMRSRRAECVIHAFDYPDGRVRWFDVRIEPVPDGICVLSMDVSDDHRVQAQLRQAQKMEAIGRLAGGIAHDFNNVLTAILGYCELVSARLEGDPELAADVGQIRSAGERAARLTRQLLAFSRKQALQPQVLDLNQVIKELEKMLSRVIGDDVRLDIRPEGARQHVRADPGQVEQVLINLAVNSRDAMAQGGVIELSTADVRLDDAFARDHPGAAVGQYVAVAVADNGAGIPSDVLPHVFEPFFTTKGPAKGTGLGLATVYGVLKQSGGYVWIDSEVGAGTTVTTYWPAVEEAVTATPRAIARTGSFGAETILLVEDDRKLRRLMRRVLAEVGYTILEAEDVADALALGRDHPGCIDLLVSDIVMPDMHGPNLAQRLLEYRSNLRVLYVSGFPHSVAPGSSSTSSHVCFLPKPFDPETLRNAVRRCLDR